MRDTSRTALVITPSFFGYEKDIVAEFERQGFETTLLDERPSNSALARAIMRVRKSLMGRRIDAYYRDWAARLTDQQFDLVLVVKAEVVPRWFLEQLRATNQGARFVFYTFDAIANASNCMDVIDLFDKRATFDRADVERHDGFEYLPLFYTSDFGSIGGVDAVAPRRYKLSFIGTLHSERFRFAKELFGELSDVFGFFYVQARWYFGLTKYLSREHSSVSWRDVSFVPLSRGQIADVFRNSLGVLDMQRDGQTGLTMRTFEVLASGAILVTTNPAVTREPFYDPARVLVVTPHPTRADHDKISAQLDELGTPIGTPDGFERYSLRSWVASLTDSVL